MEFRQVLESRHSIREFTSEPVDRDDLERVVKAAAMAPSAMNSQPYHFYVATAKTRVEVGEIVAHSTVHLQEFADVLPPEHIESASHWYASLGDAPVVIVVTMKNPTSELDELNKLLSVGTAIENLLLAAVDEGLSACNITFSFYVRDELQAYLNVGQDWKVVAVIALGHPAAPPVSPPHELNVATFLE